MEIDDVNYNNNNRRATNVYTCVWHRRGQYKMTGIMW